MLGIVYLLHFERPISDRHTTQHYTGWALDLNARLAIHRAGKGARLTQVAVERGIGFEVVRTWQGTRDFERYLKNGKRAPRLCPVCCQAHGRRCPVQALDATQLALPLFVPTPDTEEFPAPIARGVDWLEMQIVRGWRLARPQPPTIGCEDDLL